MTARGLTLLGLGLALAAVLGWLFHTQYVWTREEVWAGYQGEARDNDFLAAQRLLQRTGHPAACLDGLPARLPPPSDVLILPVRRLPMAPQDAARITAWVEAGGLLLAEAPENPAAPDPLFERFGLGLAPAPGPQPSAVTVRVGGAPLRVAMGGPVRFEGGGESRLVEQARGQGRALLCTDLSCLGNGRIRSLDHADFLCAVAGQHPGARVWIVIAENRPPSLWGWLLSRAWPFLAALATLVLAAVWAAAPRFGPISPDPAPARRGFLEHLDACGRYQWQTARGRPLLAASRKAFEHRLGLVHPGWPRLDPDDLCLRLAQSSGLPRDRIARALFSPADSPGSFLEAVQTLHHLRRRFRRASPRDRPV